MPPSRPSEERSSMIRIMLAQLTSQQMTLTRDRRYTHRPLRGAPVLLRLSPLTYLRRNEESWSKVGSHVSMITGLRCARRPREPLASHLRFTTFVHTPRCRRAISAPRRRSWALLHILGILIIETILMNFLLDAFLIVPPTAYSHTGISPLLGHFSFRRKS